jgi:hypothetical protein
MTTTNLCDTDTLRRHAIAVAAARQTIAHEHTGYLPAWTDLTDGERARATTEAGWWLEAVRRAGLAAPTVPDRATDLDGLDGAVPPMAVPCTHCGTPVLWLSSSSVARPIPIDAIPCEQNGNVLISDGRIVVLFPKQVAAAREQGSQLHVQHKWTCRSAHRGAVGGVR